MRQPDVRSPVAASPEIISAMVDRIVDGFGPLQVILFGSWARAPASDHCPRAAGADLIAPVRAHERLLRIPVRRRGASTCREPAVVPYY